jgi:glutathione S-transferase
MRVYNRSGAGRPIRVLWMLEELGVEYELVTMTSEEAAGEEHRSRHPLGRVPVLEDDEGTIFESTAVILQLADRHPDAGLVPAVGTRDRGLVYQWLFFAMTEVEPSAVQNRRTREISPEIADAAVERARAAIAVLAEALDGREFLVGDRFTVADIVASEVVAAAGRMGAYEPSGRLAQYLAAMQRRPARERAGARFA